MTAPIQVTTPEVPRTPPVAEPAWLSAARWVVERHAFATVHVPTGQRVPTPDEIYDLTEDEASLLGRPTRTTKDLTVLDATTASLLVQVWDALSENNRVIFAEFNIIKAVNVAWKLVK
ncbi:hypothetical protein [Deinococcus soli (ex Cha et al. 2016)]|uniref:Uncharacterized protein n=2 Tax=Deinococcus soli (ex Cha et al. 2016) TaxID=1309411 RepID=A0ACC6KF76_9DEIO|nr:hypothetical protein [Deinococcus soli (ex Cha et al. 2016)]MDR6218206.1 hypothetical protein [Deinococcus soli (ex Cha et al. 2016)]MDR6328946.1 hypothetical protein [Deinococcus soli (ex Cha et al. 2016)]MDR6751219.1 hypothetical protein [Deinococcus soli (ex Cha et al. 2016)]